MALQPRAAFDPEWLFAQPAQQPTAARFRQRRPGASVVTALAFSLIAVAVIASYAAPGHGTGRHQGDLHADGKTGAASSKAGNGPRRVVDSGRQPLSYYAREVRPGMFSAPVQALHRPEPLVIKTAPLPVVPPMPVNPFADWAYKGTIRSGSRIIALLENTKTHEGQFVQQGDQFMGSVVGPVSDQIVCITNAGKPYLLAKSDAFSVTQLDKNAPFL
ncbi:MAG TPA: hypothetical protein VGS41_18430, partial [Chthonomonadales bacterium]|nr:hypothetical protein [Chthonomonadales bacterium]